jgi:hypothetical protein
MGFENNVQDLGEDSGPLTKAQRRKAWGIFGVIVLAIVAGILIRKFL